MSEGQGGWQAPLEIRPMYLETTGGAIFRGGPEEARFVICRCGAPVYWRMQRQHEAEIPHRSLPPGTQTTEVRRMEEG